MHKNKAADQWIRNIGEVVTLNPEGGEGPLGILRGGAIALLEGRIVWVGLDGELEGETSLTPDGDVIDVQGRALIPGLVDSHTHLIFAGSREGEFEMRSRGESYQSIAAAGGGILSTMAHVRRASVDELLDLTLRRLSQSLAFGITTLEVKSGYGLSVEDELKMLEVARLADFSHPVDLAPTFLGAHALPPEYRGRKEDYVDLVIHEMLPKVAESGLAETCDVFCEDGAFSIEQSRRILTAAKDLGLGVRLHAEQLSRQGAAVLGAELGALSADHLEYITPEDLDIMAEGGVVAGLLPGAAFFLGQPFPSGREMIDRGVEVAIATDFNPGSSPTQNLPLMGTMAITRMGMTPPEALRAMTLGGAKSLGREKDIGSIEVGKRGDFAILNTSDYRSLFYSFGVNQVAMVIKDGDLVEP